MGLGIFDDIMEKEANRLRQETTKDILYFYAKYAMPPSASFLKHFYRNPLLNAKAAPGL